MGETTYFLVSDYTLRAGAKTRDWPSILCGGCD